MKIPACRTRLAATLALVLPVLVALSACMDMGAKTPGAADGAVLSRERIAEIVASPDRSSADRTNDIRRKPEQMLVALDLSAGGGYTTELIARAVGPSGRVFGQSAPRPADAAPRAPAAAEGAAAPSSSTSQAASTASSSPAAAPARRPSPEALAERARNPLAANIVPVVRRFEDPIPPEVASGGLDLVTLMFNYHDLGHMGVDRAEMNRAVFKALKTGALYVIADHSGRPGSGISESGTLHRIEEAFLRQEVESAGFKLAAQGNFLRNPSDPRDKNTPDPPQPKDEFVLKFVKP